MPKHVRPAFAALWSLDLALADVVATSTDPRLGAIRLAWWRERLDQLGETDLVPAEPRLQAIVAELLRRGITGSELSRLEDGWLSLLEPFPWSEAQAEALRFRGRILFGIGARLLDEYPSDAEAAGALWSLVDGARHCSDPESRSFLLAEARKAVSEYPASRPPKGLRRLTALAAIAARDALRNDPSLSRAYWGRPVAALVHHLRGTLPRN